MASSRRGLSHQRLAGAERGICLTEAAAIEGPDKVYLKVMGSRSQRLRLESRSDPGEAWPCTLCETKGTRNKRWYRRN